MPIQTRLRRLALAAAVLAAPVAAMPAATHTQAALAATGGGGTIDGSGVLPTFPCSANCHAGFSGHVSGNADFLAVIGTTTLEAAVEVTNMPISGQLTYGDGTQEFCPWWGGASPSELQPWAGTFNYTTVGYPGTLSGAILNSTTQSGGTVLNIWGTYTFKWTRVGATGVLTQFTGSTTVQYWLPGMGSSTATFTTTWTGASALAFQVPAQTAINACTTPVSNMPYSVTGPFAIGG
jgi:hypothetical protein